MALQCLAPSRFGLRGKLITAMVIVGGIPLVLAMAMALLQGTRELHDMAGQNFASLAAESARTLDLVVSQEATRTARLARSPELLHALEELISRRTNHAGRDGAAGEDLAAQRWNAGEASMIRMITENPLAHLLKEQASGRGGEVSPIEPTGVPPATRALLATDDRGVIIASTTADVPYLNWEEPWWRGAYAQGRGQPFLGTVALHPRFGFQTFDMAFPIMDRGGSRVLGVLHRILDAREYLAPSLFPIRFGKTGHVMVLDSEGVVVACPILPTGIRISDRTLVEAITRQEGGWVRAQSDGHGGHHASVIGVSVLPGTSRLMRASIGRTWHAFVWQASEELSAPTHHFFWWLTGFSGFALSLLAILGSVASRRIVTPIRTLQRAATQIATVSLTEPIRVNTGDELEQLADEMNRMNSQLEAAFRGLSDTVEQKSQEVRSLQVLNQQILDTMPNPIVLLDDHGRITYSNRAVKRTCSDHAVLATVFRQILAESHGGDPPTIEPERLDDERLIGEPGDPLAPSRLLNCLPQRHEVTIDDRLYRYQWFQVSERTHSPWRGLIFFDVTDERRLEEQVLQAERLLDLRRLTSGLGHELNNPLYAVMGLAEAILEESDVQRMKEHAQLVVMETKRMALVLKELTAETFASNTERTTVDVNGVIEEAVEDHMPTVGAVDVKLRLRPLPLIEAPVRDVRQAVIAILTNAAQAMPSGGSIEIETEATNSEIVLTVHDTGCGIPARDLAKVFGPFFTTKDQGQGRGLGLTLARHIIERLGGRITIESREGTGTTVTIRLPVVGSTPR